MNKIDNLVNRYGTDTRFSLFVREAKSRLCQNKFTRLFVPTTQLSSSNWVFIIGSYNSGTTILKDILGMHPDISVTPKEGVTLTSYLSRPDDYGYFRLTHLSKEFRKDLQNETYNFEYDKIKKDWSRLLNPNAQYYLDKSITNSYRIKFLNKFSQNVKFVVVVRNPLSSIPSHQKKSYFIENNLKEKIDLETSTKEWLSINQSILQSLSKCNFHIVQYESLCKHPKQTIGAILDFVGVEDVFQYDSLSVAYKRSLINIIPAEPKALNTDQIDSILFATQEVYNQLLSLDGV